MKSNVKLRGQKYDTKLNYKQISTKIQKYLNCNSMCFIFCFFTLMTVSKLSGYAGFLHYTRNIIIHTQLN